jgi:hypothetical protein
VKTVVFFFIVVSISAYVQGHANHEETKPTVEIVTPQHVNSSITTDSLQHLDFRNLQFNIFDEHGRAIVSTKLRNGKYKSKSDWLRMDWVHFLGETSDSAVVSLSWVATGVSASDSGIVQVFTLRDGHPVVVQQISFNTRGCGTSSIFSSDHVLLTIRGEHGWEHCCPKTLDVVTFGSERWVISSQGLSLWHPA